jgi:hypothetical protein
MKSNIVNTSLWLIDKYFDYDLENLSGKNGVYNDQETPVRNVAHWILILSKAYRDTSNVEHLKKIEFLAEYLYETNRLRPYKKTYLCRHKPGKDLCNGLIGNAWAFEGLTEASIVLGDSKYVKLAENIALSYSFDYEKSLFYTQEIDGTSEIIDYTFNHQLWFVMSLVLINTLVQNDILQKYCNDFFENIQKNLRLRKNGRIVHGLEHQFSFKRNIRTLVNKIRRGGLFKNNIPLEKEIGYHSFNTYAFAVIKDSGFKSNFWNSDLFLDLLGYLDSREYINGIEENKYSYVYNPPGYEVYYTKQVFNKKITNFDDRLLNTQIDTFLLNANLEEVGVKDIKTQIARFYEATRIKGA